MVRERSKPKIKHRYFLPQYYCLKTICNFAAPIFRPSYTEVRKGETIRLVCGAEGFPTPTSVWYRDGGRLSNAHDRYEVIESIIYR